MHSEIYSLCVNNNNKLLGAGYAPLELAVGMRQEENGIFNLSSTNAALGLRTVLALTSPLTTNWFLCLGLILNH